MNGVHEQGIGKNLEEVPRLFQIASDGHDLDAT